MIVCQHLRITYIDVPKTGSATIDRILKKNYEGRLLSNKVHGSSKHKRTIPLEYSEFTRIATVRDPYTRAVSQYLYNKQNKNLQEMTRRFSVSIESFDDFLDFLLRMDEHPADTMFHHICGWFGQSKYLSTMGYDVLLHTEKLEEEFNALSWVKTPLVLPLLNTSRKEEINLTSEQKSKIIRWAGSDFEEFGYKI